MFDFEDIGLGCLTTACALIVFGVLVILALAGIDGIQSVRARTAIYNCERQNLESVRKSFSIEVSCRARNLGSDTLNLKSIQ